MRIAFIVSLAFAVSACTTQTSTPPTAENNTQAEVVGFTTSADVAYIDVDYIISQSEIFKSEGVALQRKSDRAQAAWVQKEQELQSEAQKLQDRYQRGLITTSSAQAAQAKIQQRVAEFQTSQQSEMRSLEEEDLALSNRTRNLIHRAVQQINYDKKYRMIINATALIDADTTLNITPRVVEIVDRLYVEEQAAK